MMMMNDSNTEFNNSTVENINGTEDDKSSHGRSTYFMPLTVFSLALCVLGLLGNGTVFWILCFKMKRNQFTVYILNLAVADFTFLVGLGAWMMYTFCVLNGVWNLAIVEGYLAFFTGLLYNFGFNASIYLLMVIALERCLAVLYPFWYQCYRPKNLSAYVSIMFWLLSVLVTLLENLICTDQQYQAPDSQSCTNVYYFTSVLYLLVVPVMVISSLILLCKIQTAPKHCQPPKIYIVIAISVTIFLISVVPARILGLLLYFNVLQSEPFIVAFFFITSLCSSFNCSANPYIYMAVGRWGKLKTEEGTVKTFLEKVFKDTAETENTSKKTSIIKDTPEKAQNLPAYTNSTFSYF